jgi:uncharacterized membrane protein
LRGVAPCCAARVWLNREGAIARRGRAADLAGGFVFLIFSSMVGCIRLHGVAPGPIR